MLKERLFSPYGIKLEPFTSEEMSRGKTPDFKLILNDECVALCELKSPRDDWLDEKANEASLCKIYGGLRNDPIINKIRRHIKKAAEQFEAVDSERNLPHILLFFNHDDLSDKEDLFAAINGIYTNGIPFTPIASRAAREAAAAWIDLIIWIDEANWNLSQWKNNDREGFAVRASFSFIER